jgi:hypothetical protein
MAKSHAPGVFDFRKVMAGCQTGDFRKAQDQWRHLDGHMQQSNYCCLEWNG